MNLQAMPGQDHPRRLQGDWQGYSLDISNAEARELFQLRHGYAPDQVHRGAVIVYVGPIRQRGENAAAENADDFQTQQKGVVQLGLSGLSFSESFGS